ncbi:MAG: hypothetical protein R3B70_27480 [Polyangiaceae bacterium]
MKRGILRGRVLSIFLLAAPLGAVVAGCPEPVVSGPPGVPTSAPSTEPVAACVAPKAKLAPVLPWKDVDALCKAPHGTPWAGPRWSGGEAKVAVEIQSFLRSEEYKRAPYNWIHDASFRLTGPFEGCPCPDNPGGECAGVSRGPHPAVRIYYSPEVIDWMCTHRRGDEELPGPGDMPDNAMIIKEMIDPNAVNLALVPGTDKLWVAPIAGKPADYYDKSFSSWTIMMKNRALSADGWFWAYYDKTSKANPPIFDRCAFTTTPFPGMDGASVDKPPGCEWLPTYWQYSVPDQQYPNAQAGNYCVYCHASAQGETTFASFDNILGREIEYAWTPEPSSGLDQEDHPRRVRHRAEKALKASSEGDQCPNNPFPEPLAAAPADFRKAFPQMDPSYNEVWGTRLPSHTYDHSISMLGVASVAPSSSQFLTSDQCEGCHEAGGAGQLAVPYMVEQAGDAKIDLSPWAEWSVSPMGLAGRDPVFHSQLELERNIARDQPGLASIKDCIDNTCLHCHGGPGARQYNIDTAGKGPAGDPCKDFLPPKDQRRATDYDGALFTHSMVGAWQGENPELARYGGLARDGINCSMCHHISNQDLDQKNLPKTFTGNFRVGPPDKLYGPFPNEKSKEDIKPKPMQHTLGITPEAGAQLLSSELCGTCHTVYLPVFDARGKLAGAAYEQTTYLEWLLSDMSGYRKGSAEKTCQDCHMPHEYRGKAIHTGIANVQDTRYPKADFLLPAKDIDIAVRPYNRHSLYGLNVFLNAYAQQYPLLLGIRQQDYMNGGVEAPLLTGLESVLEIAATQTATVAVSPPAWKGDVLEAEVTVQNLSGHSLPSGVGFRRLFVQVEVLDAKGRALWASGRTNEAGLLLRGTTAEPLPTETYQKGPDGLPFQAHRQVVDSEDQVQIYEELTQGADKQFTTSFLHRYWALKDNRLRPKGYDPANVPEPSQRAEYEDATRPGTGPERNWWPRPANAVYKNAAFPAIEAYTDTKSDPDYQLAAHRGTGLPGSDKVVYRIALPAAVRALVKEIRVTLYSQSTPPSFLRERFDEASEKGAERSAAVRMYYMAGHLDTSARTPDGKEYLRGYRLQVGSPATRAVPAP